MLNRMIYLSSDCSFKILKTYGKYTHDESLFLLLVVHRISENNPGILLEPAKSIKVTV